MQFKPKLKKEKRKKPIGVGLKSQFAKFSKYAWMAPPNSTYFSYELKLVNFYIYYYIGSLVLEGVCNYACVWISFFVKS